MTLPFPIPHLLYNTLCTVLLIYSLYLLLCLSLLFSTLPSLHLSCSCILFLVYYACHYFIFPIYSLTLPVFLDYSLTLSYSVFLSKFILPVSAYSPCQWLFSAYGIYSVCFPYTAYLLTRPKCLPNRPILYFTYMDLPLSLTLVYSSSLYSPSPPLVLICKFSTVYACI